MVKRYRINSFLCDEAGTMKIAKNHKREDKKQKLREQTGEGVTGAGGELMRERRSRHRENYSTGILRTFPSTAPLTGSTGDRC